MYQVITNEKKQWCDDERFAWDVYELEKKKNPHATICLVQVLAESKPKVRQEETIYDTKGM